MGHFIINSRWFILPKHPAKRFHYGVIMIVPPDTSKSTCSSQAHLASETRLRELLAKSTVSVTKPSGNSCAIAVIFHLQPGRSLKSRKGIK